MDSQASYYLALLALIVIGVIAAKKMASCLVKTIVCVVLMVLMGAIYWLYFK